MPPKKRRSPNDLPEACEMQPRFNLGSTVLKSIWQELHSPAPQGSRLFSLAVLQTCFKKKGICNSCEDILFERVHRVVSALFISAKIILPPLNLSCLICHFSA
ncbi:hypothetical protein AVEN_273388-1 [Araneus ventricosus]|uniref:Uncharacterized protein n=1 Tax=Araneus ventricosus TaxID=182803 RepID=A0A4Y2K6K6_ARAVE|nr:hypothetical protein AVEN_273388-1 [Araneus ventricosus]